MAMDRAPIDLRVTLGRTRAPVQGALGNIISMDLCKAPHALVAGTTGSGKSALVNSIITELVTTHRDDEVGLLLFDPKRVEFARFKGLPHLYWPPIYEPEEYGHFLRWAVMEMNARFAVMERHGCSTLDEYNTKTDGQRYPKMVVVIDELANVILMDKTAEDPLVRLASMGRAAGIHLILATQRPSADVVTGLIRANVPTRICMRVATAMESRIIIDVGGAERLGYPGEALVRRAGASDLTLLRTRYIDDEQMKELLRSAS